MFRHDPAPPVTTRRRLLGALVRSAAATLSPALLPALVPLPAPPPAAPEEPGWAELWPPTAPAGRLIRPSRGPVPCTTCGQPHPYLTRRGTCLPVLFYPLDQLGSFPLADQVVPPAGLIVETCCLGPGGPDSVRICKVRATGPEGS